MENNDLGAETCSKATPQAGARLGPSGYDQGESVALAQMVIEVARKDHAEWISAARREDKMGNDAEADACYSGANSVQQVILRMEKALRKAIVDTHPKGQDREAGLGS